MEVGNTTFLQSLSKAFFTAGLQQSFLIISAQVGEQLAQQRAPSVKVAQAAVIKQQISKWLNPVHYPLIFVSKIQFHINMYYNVEC